MSGTSAREKALEAAIEIRTWSEEERECLDAAFRRAEARGRGHYETLFTIAAEAFRIARRRADAVAPKGD